jgi:hypothetical protein
VTGPRRAAFRYTEWTLGPERDGDGRTLLPVREVQCQKCGRRSGAHAGQQYTDRWALEHAGLTHHRAYLEIVTAALTAHPALTNPRYEAQQEQPPS